jgi:hypothetical protein
MRMVEDGNEGALLFTVSDSYHRPQSHLHCRRLLVDGLRYIVSPDGRLIRGVVFSYKLTHKMLCLENRHHCMLNIIKRSHGT